MFPFEAKYIQHLHSEKHAVDMRSDLEQYLDELHVFFQVPSGAVSVESRISSISSCILANSSAEGGLEPPPTPTPPPAASSEVSLLPSENDNERKYI